MTSDPPFAIPARPERSFSRGGRLRYEGDTTFRLTPDVPRSEDELEPLVAGVLSDGPYRSGTFFDLPMAVWLVRDDDTADVFRVSIRDGTVRLHVLPETDPEGLRRFYDRLVDASECAWTVECRTDLA